MAGRAVTFNGLSLQSTNIFVNDIDDGSLPTRQVSIFTLAHANASKVPYDSFPTKTISVKGTMRSDTIANFDTLLDTFKASLVGVEKNLDVDYAGTTRRYIATVNSMTLSRPGGLTYGEFAIQFLCSSPFGTAISATTLLNVTGRTAATYSDSISIGGTAPWQRPIYTITLTAVTSTGQQTVNVSNAANGQQISVTRAWVAGDTMTIDTSTKSVKVNGVETDYSGAFPELATGSQTVAYSDSLTTRTFSYSIAYNPMYL